MSVHSVDRSERSRVVAREHHALRSAAVFVRETFTLPQLRVSHRLASLHTLGQDIEIAKERTARAHPASHSHPLPLMSGKETGCVRDRAN